MEIRISITRSRFLLVVCMLAMIVAMVAVQSWGTTNPAVVGHSAGEIVVDSSSIVDGSIQVVDLMDAVLNASKVDTSQIQLRVDANCTAGSSIRAIGADGSVTCESDDTGGSVSCSLLTTDCNSTTQCQSPSTGNNRLTGVACDCDRSDVTAARVSREVVSVGVDNRFGTVTCYCTSPTDIRAAAIGCS